MTTNFVQLDKTSKKALTFVKAATSKDYARESLMNINFNTGMLACDGHRLHYAVCNPTGLEGLYRVDKIADVIQPEDHRQDNYPNYKSIVNDASGHEDKAMYFSINAKFLVDALKQCGEEMVTFRVVNANMPIEIASRIDENVTVYSLIMPMHCNDQPKNIANARP
jgi:DNA polymerase III sliding clamp (beta) subunit (PCNA family)